MRKGNKSEFLLAAKLLLDKERRPMTAKELVELAARNSLFTDKIAGKTPHQTMKSKLSVNIKRLGIESEFVRTNRGRFYLRALLDSSKEYQATPNRPPEDKDRILVFKAAEMDQITVWQGIWHSPEGILKQIKKALKPEYLPRLSVELDDCYTQITTYVLVFSGERILSYRRGTYNRTEKNLQGAYCIGFGGHVSETDTDLFSSEDFGIGNCATRELLEELDLSGADTQRIQRKKGLKLLGILNDDSSCVGRRHLAFVFRYDMDPSSDFYTPQRGEKSITQLSWISEASLGRHNIWKYEYWSQLCLRAFTPYIALMQPKARVIRLSRLRDHKVLFLIGAVGSGKSQAADVLQEEFGYHVLNTGKILAQLLQIPPIPETPRAIFQEKAFAYVSIEANAQAFASVVAEEAHILQTGNILIDGVRQRTVLEGIQKRLAIRNTCILYILTPPDIALGFFKGREDPSSSNDAYWRLRNAAVEQEVEQLITLADAILYNATGMNEYIEELRGLMYIRFKEKQ